MLVMTEAMKLLLQVQVLMMTGLNSIITSSFVVFKRLLGSNFEITISLFDLAISAAADVVAGAVVVTDADAIVDVDAGMVVRFLGPY